MYEVSIVIRVKIIVFRTAINYDNSTNCCRMIKIKGWTKNSASIVPKIPITDKWRYFFTESFDHSLACLSCKI